jgi:hypothetical protein
MTTSANTLKKELTYEDFKIGQKVTCTNYSDDFWEEYLTIGKTYKIKDIDFHFWDKICIKSEKGQCFVPIKFFSENLRKKKLKRILKIK